MVKNMISGGVSYYHPQASQKLDASMPVIKQAFHLRWWRDPWTNGWIVCDYGLLFLKNVYSYVCSSVHMIYCIWLHVNDFLVNISISGKTTGYD